MTSRRRARVLLSALLALAGCASYESDPPPLLEMNTCTLQTDCGADAECRDSMCVAKSADEPLTIVLQVTPARVPNGSDPQPIVLERFLVDGPMTRTFELPMPMTLEGRVRNANVPIEATVTFTPFGLASGLPVRTVTVTTSTRAPNAVETSDYTVELFPGIEYRMAVQPNDSALPPHYATVTVDDPEAMRVDYGPDLDAFTRLFSITGAAAEERPLLVRAFDRETSELLSSTATVIDGAAMLRFAQGPPPFRIEVRAETSYDGEQPPAAEWCDANTPIFPVFTFDDDELVEDADGAIEIALPELPARIRFEGTIGLCAEAEELAMIEAEMGDAVAPPDLPVTLHSRSLLGADGMPLAAAFDATTTATLDPMTGEVRFCVQVLPGDYDVLATPAPSVACSLFAEHFLISAPEGSNASGPRLELPSAGYVKGTVQSMVQPVEFEPAPLSHATVDAVALGRSEGVMLDASDRSVTRYNRSSQTNTEADGEFKLPVDLGSYDLVIKPQTGTGFSWQVRHDVEIGGRGIVYPTMIDMVSPVTLNGTLVFSGGGRDTSLEGAEIAAFAIIDDEFDTERAVPIGRATAGEDGKFTLLLPPSMYKGL